jgi:hypothetical protein
VIPELARDLDRVYAGRLPPCSLVAGAVDLTVVNTAERDGEFVASPSTEGPRLHVSKMMRVRRLAAADEACLLGDVTQMLAVAVPARCSDREDALVNAFGQNTFGSQGFRLVLRHHRWRGTLGCEGVG